MATIDRHHEKRIFSDFNNIAVFDKDFNIVWCDNPKMFRRIAAAHERLSNKMITSDNGGTVIYFFLYKGIYHRARVDIMPDGNYIFRVAREITYEELSDDDLFEYLDEMSHSCLNILNLTDILENYIDNTMYNFDGFHENYCAQRKETLGIYSRCQNVIRIFNEESNSEFIPLHKYLYRTLDIVQHATKKLPRKIALNCDIVFPATKIDYSKFELALYNLIKFALIYSAGQKDLLFFVRRSSLKEIELETSFRVYSGFKFDNCKVEMHIIKHLFRKLNGHFEFYQEDNMIYAKGSFEAEFSLDASVIAPGRDIEFIDDPELLEKKATSEKYIKIYNNVPAKRNMLASNQTDFSDVDDVDVDFAEMFFGDISIND